MTKAIPPRLLSCQPHHIQRGRRACQPEQDHHADRSQRPEGDGLTKELHPSRFPAVNAEGAPAGRRRLTSQTSLGVRYGKQQVAERAGDELPSVATDECARTTVSSQPNPLLWLPERRSQVGRAEESSPVSLSWACRSSFQDWSPGRLPSSSVISSISARGVGMREIGPSPVVSAVLLDPVGVIRTSGSVPHTVTRAPPVRGFASASGGSAPSQAQSHPRPAPAGLRSVSATGACMIAVGWGSRPRRRSSRAIPGTDPARPPPPSLRRRRR